MTGNGRLVTDRDKACHWFTCFWDCCILWYYSVFLL